MPIFQNQDGVLTTIPQIEFATERELQRLVENNLEEIFGCSFVATEFRTGQIHGGRIDTLAISEEGFPVIIEYKKVESADLINQSLYYLDWIKDHRGDFENAVRAVLPTRKVEWAHVRVICIAPGYNKFSLFAVKQIGSGLELWKYQRLASGLIHLEEVFRESSLSLIPQKATPNESSELVEAIVEKPNYSFDSHRSKIATTNLALTDLLDELREYLLGLNEAITETPNKLYVAYKVARNFATIEVQRSKIVVGIKLSHEIEHPPWVKDVSRIGHWGTGDTEIHLSEHGQLELVKSYLRDAYLAAGGD